MTAISHLDETAGLGSPRVRHGLSLPDGEIWVATDRTLDRVKDGVVVASYDHANPAPAPGGRISAIATDRTGDTWMATADGLARFDDGLFTRVLPGLPDARVLSLLATDDAMLAGTWRGLARVPYDNPVAVEIGWSGLPQQPVTALHAADSLWVGFAGAGLWIGSPTGPFTPLVESWRGKALTVTALSRDRDGNVWIGTAGNGLLRWRSSTATVESVLPAGDVLCLTAGAGGIWVGTNSGLYKWHDSALSRLSSPAEGIAVIALAVLGHETVLAGTWGRGLLRCGENRSCSAAGLQDREIVDLAVIDGAAWVSTTEGLVIVEDAAAMPLIPI